METVTVRNIMTPGTMTSQMTCDENTPIERAAAIMRQNNICQLGVTERGVVTGVVTLKALLQHQGGRRLHQRVMHALLGTDHCPLVTHRFGDGNV